MPTTPKVLIAYTSLTGNTEEAAFLLKKELEKIGAQVDIDELEMLSPRKYLDQDICIVATYSYDSGGEVLPDEAQGFFQELGGLDLTEKVFGVIGSGQDFYEWYCGAVDRFEEQFEKAGARKGAMSMKFEWDISTPEDQTKLLAFATDLIEAYQEKV